MPLFQLRQVPGRGGSLSARLVPLLVAGLLAACSASPDASPAGSEPARASSDPVATAGVSETSNPANVDAAVTFIKAADVASNESMEAIEDLRFTPEGLDAAKAVLVTGATGDALWAATWIYASSGREASVLSPLLANGDASIRIMSAAALIALGEPGGFTVIKASLSDTSPVHGAVPTTSLASFSVWVLASYVDTPGTPGEAASEAEASAVAAGWSTWLAGHQASLTFDSTTGTWKL